MPQLDNPQLTSLSEQIQLNCAISDARHARDYSLCIYLLRMREYYRWQQDIPLNTAVDTTIVGDWITDVELSWEDLEDSDYQPLEINGGKFDPFDIVAINAQLQQHNVVYSAGIGRMGQAHFFLASLDKTEQQTDITLYECGTEYARDSIIMPAMTQGRSVFIRRDSLSRMLWQMIDEWRLNPRPGAMQRLLEHLKLDPDSVEHNQINNAAAQLSWVVREHERGEVLAGELLGSDWSDMVQFFIGKPGEYYLRAVRDMTADTLHSWPAMVEQAKPYLLDFWLAGITGAREKWLNSLGLLERFEAAECESRLTLLNSIHSTEHQRWLAIAHALTQRYQSENNVFDVEATVSEMLQHQG